MIICGLDECGRGALAGPLVAAGVVLNQPASTLLSGCPALIRDSKARTPQQRQIIADYIKTKDVNIVIESLTVTDINANGIAWANRTIFDRIISKLPADHYIVDGNLKLESAKNYSVESLIKADTKVVEVMLASIVAKVYRDKLMTGLHPDFPMFCWEKNKGYGSQDHISALSKYGPCLHHRTIFVTTALRNFKPHSSLT